MQLEESSNTWLLDQRGSSTVHQLERTQGSVFGITDFSNSQEYYSTDTHRQHDQYVLHQQTRWDSFSSPHVASNSSMDMVLEEQHYATSPTHSGHSQQSSGLRVASPVLQESMDDQASNLPTSQSEVGPIFSGPLCRQNDQAIAKVRLVDSGSSRYPYGCVYHPMEELSTSFHQPSLEPDYSGTTQNHSGTTSTSDFSGALLAQRSLVSSGTTNGIDGSLAVTSSSSSNNIPHDTSPSTTAELDALRVEIIRKKLVNQNLNAQAVEDLLVQRLAPNGTNRLYRKNQLRFLAWATQNNVSYTAFTPSDLVNFLADMRQEHNLQASTLKTLRAAVTHLHDDSTGISEDTLISSYIDTITKQATPVSIHRPTIDVAPALAYARTIASRSSTKAKLLQQKLAFLLAMAAFLRPSDLVRIPFASCSILDNGRLHFQVVAPKETRGKRRIIKPFTVHPHTEDFELCPIQCFKALRDHPALQARPANSNLFVKSNNVHQPLSASTISTWLHREFISLCTDESGVSIRSLASSRALDMGVPQDSIVALGNWASSDTFVRHYQRNQMAQVDFTSTVLSSQDEFFDANDSFGTLD